MVEKKVQKSPNCSQQIQPQTERDPLEPIPRTSSMKGREHQNEVQIATVPVPSSTRVSSQTGPRCVNGQLLHVQNHLEMILHQQHAIPAASPLQEAVRLGKANPPCFGQPPPGIAQVPSRHAGATSPPPPPPSSSARSPTANAEVYPR